MAIHIATLLLRYLVHDTVKYNITYDKFQTLDSNLICNINNFVINPEFYSTMTCLFIHSVIQQYLHICPHVYCPESTDKTVVITIFYLNMFLFLFFV